MKSLLVIGSGESGTGAAILAKQKDWEVRVSDGFSIWDEFKQELINHRIPFEENGHSPKFLDNLDLLIKSPGVPDSAAVIALAKERRIPVVSEIEFAYSYCPGKIIGITGSNGKTTTTLLTYHLLQRAGKSVEIAGNVGTSFARILAEKKPADWYVLELSSFQIDGLKEFHPDIAAILNITPDHLDRYDNDMGIYIRSKLSIAYRQSKGDLLIINGLDSNIMANLDTRMLEQKLIHLEVEDQKTASIHLEGRPLRLKNPYLKGAHNKFNASCAVRIANWIGISHENIQGGLDSFENKPHRMETVASLNGVLYINDSKATNVDSTFYALDVMDKPVVWIAGGKDKGNVYESLMDLVVQKVKGLVCLGLDNSKLKGKFSGSTGSIVETTKMKDAVEKANEMAERGDVVLLSPACASFDLFGNYEDRGDQFRNEVFQLLRNKN